MTAPLADGVARSSEVRARTVNAETGRGFAAEAFSPLRSRVTWVLARAAADMQGGAT